MKYFRFFFLNENFLTTKKGELWYVSFIAEPSVSIIMALILSITCQRIVVKSISKSGLPGRPALGWYRNRMGHREI